MFSNAVVKIVAKRYYIDMNCDDYDNAQTVAEMIVRLGRSTHDYAAGMSPAQWAVLRYLSHANRFSRTVSAFAEFHATTRGTVSQTVKSLVKQGLVVKTRSGKDGRSARLDLTETGRELLSEDPCLPLIAAVEELPSGIRRQTAQGLRRILGRLEVREGVRAFGACTDCAHLENIGASDCNTNEFACALKGEVLDFEEISRICVDYQTRLSSARR